MYEMQCDVCGMMFPEDVMIINGSSTICKWCDMNETRKQIEDENKLTYSNIAKHIDKMRRAFSDDEEDW